MPISCLSVRPVEPNLGNFSKCTDSQDTSNNVYFYSVHFLPVDNPTVDLDGKTQVGEYSYQEIQPQPVFQVCNLAVSSSIPSLLKKILPTICC